MMNITVLQFIVWMVLVFLGGIAVGALIVYKKEEDVLTTFINKASDLTIAEKELRQEREEFQKTRSMIDIIENVPEYLREKYYTDSVGEKEYEDTNTGDIPDEDIQIYM